MESNLPIFVLMFHKYFRVGAKRNIGHLLGLISLGFFCVMGWLK